MRNQLLLFFCFPFVMLAGQNYKALWDSSYRDYQSGHYFAAIEKLEQFVSRYPDSKIAWLNLGKAYGRIMDMEHRCAAFAKAGQLGSAKASLRNKWVCEGKLKQWMAKYYFRDKDIIPGNDYRPLFTLADTLRGGLSAARTCYDVVHYNLQLEIFPRQKEVKGFSTITLKVLEPTDSIQLDLDQRLTIDSIVFHSRAVDFTRLHNAVYVYFPQGLVPSTEERLTVWYHGRPRTAPNPPWDGGLVWKKDNRGHRWLGVACEHLGASVWWPCKDHLSDKPDSMTISLILPEKLVGVSNGTLLAAMPAGKGKMLYRWRVYYPIVNYNATFYAGNFVSFTDTFRGAWGNLPLDYYVLPQNLKRAQAHFGQTKEVLEVFEKYFGPYPFYRDGFALVESPYAGMEHQGAIAYGNGYGRNRTHRFRNSLYDHIIVHEAAHEWWGNSVTIADMADIWIHEGFATYAEILFIDEQLGTNEGLWELNDKYSQIFNFWPLVGTAGVNDNSFASGDVYNKGAAMLHGLRCLFDNDSVFFSLIRKFAEENRYKVVQTADFVAMAEEISGLSLQPFFAAYLNHSKPPVLQLRVEKSDTSTFLFYQWTSVPEGFTMPFALGTTGETVRLMGSTDGKCMEIGSLADLKIFTMFTGPEGCPVNSFTYFYTRFDHSAN